jgi:hypothetical protein
MGRGGSALQRYLALVAAINGGGSARSELDLCRHLAEVLEGIGLATVVDTSQATGTRKRPDILGYTDRREADIILPAEVVVETKKPQEIAGYRDLKHGLVESPLWEEKTLPCESASKTDPIAF